MNKIEYFKKACQAGLYKHRNWVFAAFTVVQEDPSAWKKGDTYAWRINQTPAGAFFVKPELDSAGNFQLEPIEGTRPGEPPFNFLEAIDLEPGDFPNVKEKMTVSLGNLFFNLCSIIPAFGSKMDFVKGEVKIEKIEAAIAKRLKSTPKEGEVRSDEDLYVDEYLVFRDSFSYLVEFTQICTVALTPKAITQAPGTIELRKKLVKEYEGRLDDPVVVAKIEAELMKHDAEYLKGDPSENFLITKKSRTTARKKLFLDYGADAGLTKSFKVDFIQKSLSEGWDVSKMPTMINALRAGSYDRGAETALGGEAVKWLYRASSNVNILDTDCGSRLGIAINVNEHNKNKLVKMRIITQSSTKLVEDEKDAEQYLGKRLMVRSPMYCKLPKTDYCRYCVGEKLGVNPNSGASAIAKLGSKFLTASLAKFHASNVKIERGSLEEFLS